MADDPESGYQEDNAVITARGEDHHGLRMHFHSLLLEVVRERKLPGRPLRDTTAEGDRKRAPLDAGRAMDRLKCTLINAVAWR
jgi:hypothetical protein